MQRPVKGDYGDFYQGYIDTSKGDSLNHLLQLYPEKISTFINSLTDAKADYSYAPGKWTIKQLLQHLIDTERVLSYRALRISRLDKTPLAGFDENAYAANATVGHRTLNDLKKEFMLLREATDLMIASFTKEQLNLSGMVSNHHITLNAICFIIYGHNLHHIKMMEERYLHGS